MENNNSLVLVHGAAIYEQQDNFSVDNNMTSEEFLKAFLGPQRQDDQVELAFLLSKILSLICMHCHIVTGNNANTED